MYRVFTQLKKNLELSLDLIVGTNSRQVRDIA